MEITNTIRVILADDHAMIRRGIRRILEKGSNILIVGESGSGMEAIHLVHELKPDVLLLDIEMPDMNGHEVARELRLSNSNVTILALSAYDDKHFIKATLLSGINGYLQKSQSPAKIREAIYHFAVRRSPIMITTFVLFFVPNLIWTLSQSFDSIQSLSMNISLL